MSRFSVSPASQGRWLNLGNLAGDGMQVRIKFDNELGMIVEKRIPAVVMEELEKDINYQRDIWKKGSMIGNTQRHRLPVASIPLVLHNQWKEELGDPKHDPVAAKKWRQRLNSIEYRNFRTSEYNL